ncbi:MAG: HU family DNA-binding protein [Elusimicrobia bacterium]|nr:HU family DNA-binding protein [Elusimicrobiota bacterium]
MNKKDLIESLTQLFATRKEAKDAIEKVFSTIRQALRKGDKVIISELGTFRTYISKAREGRNPNTGEIFQVPPKRKIRFRQSKDLFD